MFIWTSLEPLAPWVSLKNNPDLCEHTDVLCLEISNGRVISSAREYTPSSEGWYTGWADPDKSCWPCIRKQQVIVVLTRINSAVILELRSLRRWRGHSQRCHCSQADNLHSSVPSLKYQEKFIVQNTKLKISTFHPADIKFQSWSKIV